MRGVPFHVYYLHFSQYAHPMGSGRPQWAAGECTNSTLLHPLSTDGSIIIWVFASAGICLELNKI